MNTLRIAWLELRLVVADPWSILWLLVLPLVMIYFFAEAFPRRADPSRTTVELDVWNRDTGFLGGALLGDLEEQGFEIRRLDRLEARGAAWLRTLVIPEMFTERLLAGEKVTLLFDARKEGSPSGDAAARVKIFKAVGKIVGNLCLAEIAPRDRGTRDENREASYRRIAALEPLVVLESSFLGPGRVIPGGYNQTVPGMIVMSVIFSVTTYGTGLFARDRRRGMLRRLVATPCRRPVILAGKLAGRLAMGGLQILILLAVSGACFGFYLGNTALGWVLCLVPYTLACGALGMLLGCFFRSEERASPVSWIPAMLMAALGGCWWPRDIMPDALISLGHLFPPAWAMDGLQEIISFGGEAISVLPAAAVLTGFFGLFMTLCVVCLRYD